MINGIQSNIKKIIIYLSVSIPFLVIFNIYSYKYLDRPIAIFIYKTFPFTRAHIIPFTHFVKHITNFAYLGFIFLFLIFYLIQTEFRLKAKLYFFLKEIFINLIISYSVIRFLKYILGRSCVREGSNYKIEVIADYSRYGFHMFSEHSSFPSGHITLITALMITILFYYPKLRTGCIGIIILASALVLYLNLHYLSDIITGIYLGTTIPFCIHQLLRKGNINQ